MRERFAVPQQGGDGQGKRRLSANWAEHQESGGRQASPAARQNTSQAIHPQVCAGVQNRPP